METFFFYIEFVGNIFYPTETFFFILNLLSTFFIENLSLLFSNNFLRQIHLLFFLPPPETFFFLLFTVGMPKKEKVISSVSYDLSSSLNQASTVTLKSLPKPKNASKTEIPLQFLLIFVTLFTSSLYPMDLLQNGNLSFKSIDLQRCLKKRSVRYVR